MRTLARRIKHPLDVPVQRPHDADPRKHRGPTALGDEDQRLHRGLPFRRVVLGFRELGHVGRSIPQGEELSAVRHRDRIIEAGRTSVFRFC